VSNKLGHNRITLGYPCPMNQTWLIQKGKKYKKEKRSPYQVFEEK